MSARFWLGGLVAALSFTAFAGTPGGLSLQRFPNGSTSFSQPIGISAPNDGSGRVFIIERCDDIVIVQNGSVLATPFVSIDTACSSEQGILGLAFDPDTPPGGRPTARLTPEFEKKLTARIEGVKKGIEWDPISTCAPPGMPRWLSEPFLREFIVTPKQTWLINEMVNDIRRVYTDGRGHVPEEDRYPLYNGDSIGFWDGDHLVIHTNQLQAGIYQRAHPDYTEQVETVEIWHKGDPTTLLADVWVYDPPALAEPWYVQQAYKKVDEQGGNLRIRYWNCGENQNNSVYQTKDGTTQFHDFTFDGARAAQPRGERK